MNKLPLIEIEDLKVGYDGKQVLYCPSLRVFGNDFIGVTGPNGGGKTTLIKALLKSIPYLGRISYSEALESGGIRRIGYLPQVHAIDHSFPIEAFEVVLSGLQAQKGFRGRYTKADRERVEVLLDFTGIKSLKNRVIGSLSGGEFQRVMLCRALISEPLLLVLDEPDNFVDNAFERELHHLLAQLADRMAIMLVSHNPGVIDSHVKTILHVDRTVTVQRSSE